MREREREGEREERERERERDGKMGWGGKETGREWRINMIQTSTPHIIIPRDSYMVRPQL